MDPSSGSEPDSLLAGKYRLIRQIGRGGMGTVFEAVHAELGQRVALKMLNREVVTGWGRDAFERFRREARAAACLKSQHVARVTDIDHHPDGTPFMVMEYLEGNDLGRELSERTQLPVAEAVDYVLQACRAMHEAHAAGIVHRDLKPDNLFLTTDGERRIVKVLDFGISKLATNDSVRVTHTLTALGTPLYMSPEQIRSAKDVDHRTDVWSLGVILYEALAGRPPFPGTTAPAVIASITADTPTPLGELCAGAPPELCAVVMRALEKDPEVRWPSVHELARALEPFAAMARFEPVSRIGASLGGATPAAEARTIELAVTTPMSIPELTASSSVGTSAGSQPIPLRRRLGLTAVVAALLVVAAGAALWATFRNAEPVASDTPAEQEPIVAPAAAPHAPTSSAKPVSSSPEPQAPASALALRPRPIPRRQRAAATATASATPPAPSPARPTGKAPENPLAL